MAIVHLTDKNFEQEVLKSNLPVLVDFWADWCAPCKTVAPILEEVASQFEGRIKIAKINIEEGRNTATKYAVMSIPTFIFFKNGEALSQKVGVINRDQLVKEIEDNL
jgi:thioredoxin 1